MVTGTVVNLTRASNGSFRYYGQLLMQSPARYRGKQVELFAISHNYDLSTLVGKGISFTCGDDDLTRSVEPAPDPFSVAQAEPHVSLEYTDEGFHTIDYLSYDKPVSVTGVIRSYTPEKSDGTIYFQFDVGYSGDMASLEIATPAKYKGLIIHVLVTDRARSWQKVGAKVSFSVSESTLAWEPWGFTPTDWLHSLAISDSLP